MEFLRNTWYIAGWASSFTQTMVSRIFLDEPIVLFRNAGGTIRALKDRCPHRFVPLHLGTLEGDQIRCRYHGLVFNDQGMCVHNPHGDGLVPRAACVHAYPVAERHGFAWIWMGDPALADTGLVPDFSGFDPASHYVGQDYLHVKANYQLETDNILDLSHIEFLHQSSLGSDEVAKGQIEVVQNGNVVHSKRFTQGERLTEELERLRGVPPGQAVDRWLDVRWNAPANMLLTTGFTPTGQARDAGREVQVAHVFTPETQATTHYWFGISFPKSLGDNGRALAAQNIEWLRKPFETEDLPVLQAQQVAMGERDFWSMKPVLLPSDGAGVRARRLLQSMIRSENAVQEDAAAISTAS
ncbi:MAG: aromatic ring-hydroxylating dioxygenase subunit alpha [Polaromonas sp.]|uniref:aromatic ring-hydroxylating dioxygenase subunit alpha n=1 Tax=Polaromonas sp. TaxID=1869339 RepID=UPI0025E6CE5D|nr:aromatic ring-hydroxylating dioxygenase subunit alpha [Polaromonas sp.]MBI2725207.1 aromatic ring-hydroxylating dioxygenase subunit alpha [Polaromonas sp.]